MLSTNFKTYSFSIYIKLKKKIKMVKFIKSPINYIGGKYKLLPQIMPLFPSDINTFVDLFTGGANVGINIKAKKVILNDNLTFLIELYQVFKQTKLNEILDFIDNRIQEFKLSLTNEEGYLKLRSTYNEHKNPLDLFVLISFAFNHQIRFNNSHLYNAPFGKNRSRYNDSIKNNLINFVKQLQLRQFELKSSSFELLQLDYLTTQDFVYCDPPYLISTGTYNDGKRGFKGWSSKEEQELLNLLNKLHKLDIKFALSNVLCHKGKENSILINWLKENSYMVHELNFNYNNSSYNKLHNNSETREVLITNY